MKLTILLLCYSFSLYSPLDCPPLPESLPAPKAPAKHFGEALIQIGHAFEGQPYVGGTLDQNESECLVLHYDRFDCVTFCETALAIARSQWLDTYNSEGIAKQLEWIRYRDGQRSNYLSRLHYSLDWIWNNQKKGVVRDKTKALGGIPFPVKLNFMSQHPSSYPRLKPEDLAALQEKEAEINARKHYYIPKEKVAKVEPLLHEGDLVFFTTDLQGLDISHLGMIVRDSGRARLLHASLKQKQVVVDANFLADYIASVKHDTGLIIVRPLTPSKQGKGPK